MKYIISFTLILTAFSIMSISAKISKSDKQKQLQGLISSIDARITVIKTMHEDYDEDKLGTALKTLRSVEKKMKKIVSEDDILPFMNKANSLMKKIDSLETRAKAGKNKGNLGVIRTSIMIYFAEHDGTYPKNLQELIPEYLEEIPVLELPNHNATNEVRVITEFEGKDIKPYIKDSGKWTYIADPKSESWGEVFIDCSHKDHKGEIWYKF